MVNSPQFNGLRFYGLRFYGPRFDGPQSTVKLLTVDRKTVDHLPIVIVLRTLRVFVYAAEDGAEVQHEFVGSIRETVDG